MPRPRKTELVAEPDTAADAAPSPTLIPVEDASVSSPPGPVKKTDMVLALLAREDGATVAEMMEATGWLAHTTRAALTGLRKKCHVLVKSKRGDLTCYRLAVGG